MVLESGEVDEIALQSEGWDLIADLLLASGTAFLIVDRTFSSIVWISGGKDAMYSSMFLGCNRIIFSGLT